MEQIQLRCWKKGTPGVRQVNDGSCPWLAATGCPLHLERAQPLTLRIHAAYEAFAMDAQQGYPQTLWTTLAAFAASMPATMPASMLASTPALANTAPEASSAAAISGSVIAKTGLRASSPTSYNVIASTSYDAK